MNVVQVRDWSGLAVYAALIFFLSSQSTLPIPMSFPNQDKLVHASAYAVMGLLAWRALKYRQDDWVLAVLAVGFASLYGVSDEFHQSFVPGRDADVWDWLADTTGATLMVAWLYRRSCKKDSLA